MSQIVKGIHYN